MPIPRCSSMRGCLHRGRTRSAAGHRFTIVTLAICGLALLIEPTSCLSREAPTDAWEGLTSSCTAEDPRNASVSCHGVRIVRKVVQQLLDQSAMTPSLELSKGVHLVEVAGGSSPRRARFLRDYGAMGPVLEFLEGKELRVKLPSILPENLESALKESLPAASQGRGKGGGGFGGGKKGDGGMLLMALMMGKMMSALGFGALALLAMKALMVSALALMLSLIVAVKKLAGGHDDGGGHHVVYAQEVGGHHHRRKRSYDDEDEDALRLPYRAYTEFYS